MSAHAGTCDSAPPTRSALESLSEYLLSDTQTLVSLIELLKDVRPLLQVLSRKYLDGNNRVLFSLIRHHGFECFKDYPFLDNGIAASLLFLDLSGYSSLTKRDQLDPAALFLAALEVLQTNTSDSSSHGLRHELDALLRFAPPEIFSEERTVMKVLAVDHSRLNFFFGLGVRISLPVYFAAVSGAIVHAPDESRVVLNVRDILSDMPQFVSFFETDALRLYFLERGAFHAVLEALGRENFSALVSNCKDIMLLALVGAERLSLLGDPGVTFDVSTQLMSLVASNELKNDVSFLTSAFSIAPRSVYPYLPAHLLIVPSVLSASIASCSAKFPPVTILENIPNQQHWIHPLAELIMVLPLAVVPPVSGPIELFREVLSILKRLCLFLLVLEKWQTLLVGAKRMNGPFKKAPEPLLDEHGQFLPVPCDPQPHQKAKSSASARCLFFEVLTKPVYRDRVFEFMGLNLYLAPASMLANAYFNAKEFVLPFLETEDVDDRLQMMKVFSDIEHTSWILNRRSKPTPVKVFLTFYSLVPNLLLMS